VLIVFRLSRVLHVDTGVEYLDSFA
jgi:hypothetical protein